MSARSTVSPPTPESNTPIGPSGIVAPGGPAQAVAHRGADADFRWRDREQHVEVRVVGGAEQPVQRSRVLVGIGRRADARPRPTGGRGAASARARRRGRRAAARDAREPPGRSHRRPRHARAARSATSTCPAHAPSRRPGSDTAWPSTSSTRSRATPPSRRIVVAPPAQSTIVDSTPTRHGPSSRIMSTSSPRSARTSRAEVGLTRPNRLADGAATPPPNARSSASATGWSGTRSATVGSPPVTSSGTRSVRGSTRVSGPGQNAAASARASGLTSAAQSASWSTDATCTITGWSAGRPFTA